MSQKNLTSILGKDSSKYTNNEPSKYIVDNPEEGILDLCPRAFSKVDSSGISRQVKYEKLYNVAKQRGVENNQYPFGFNSVVCELIPEPNNKADKNAIRVVLKVGSTEHDLDDLHEFDMGYIPMEISAIVKKNLSMVNLTIIKNLYKEVHSKYYQARISIGYTNKGIVNPEHISRFDGLLDD